MNAESPLDVDRAPTSPAVQTRLVERAGAALASRTSRRGFLARSAVIGSALAVAPLQYVLRPGTAYAAVCNCSGQSCGCGSTCCDGYTEFCCTLTGQNTCPPGTAAGGWWKADAPGLCGSAPRYYLDCNVLPGHAPCRCGCGNGNCGNRKACCTQFRYGQCHREIPSMGPIMCRVVTCMPPWEFDATCTHQALTDNNTRGHDRPCLHDAEPGRGPALAVAPDGRLFVFARGTNRAMFVRSRAPNGSWGAWNSLGGGFSSDPDATADSNGDIHVFGRGDDNGLWVNTFDGGSWTGWRSLGGGLSSGPGACAGAGGRVYVFARGNDNGLWMRTFNGGSWSGWANLGGILSSAPDATTLDSGEIQLYTRGNDQAVWGRRLTGSGWTGWSSLGGIITSGPATTSGNGTLDVFAMGTNHGLWMRTTQNGRWSGWLALGGSLISDPDAVTHDGQTTVVGRGTNGAVWANARSGGRWSGWFSMGAPG
jgi:hypothetical protein